MSIRNVVIGAGGRLGSALCAAGDPGSSTRALRRSDMDLEDHDAIRTVLEDIDYDILWLTAALTNVDYCESHPEQTKKVNSDAVAQIARISATKGARVVLFSTDYVFDGDKNEPYVEEDTTNPLNVYGHSKLQAEEHLLNESDQNLVIRLSWLFGHNKPGFPDWAIRQAMEKDSISVVTDRHSSPTYTEDVVRAVKPLMKGEMQISGILHLCNQGVCTWKEWAQHSLDCAADNGIPLRCRETSECHMTDIKSFVAARPIYSAMSTQRYQSLTGLTMPGWKEAVSHYIETQLAPKLAN